MSNISQSKLLRPWTWIGRRKKLSIVLPPETLIHILHYFPRKQLIKRYSRVNSSFFNVANRLSSNVHVIDRRNIKFCFTHQRTYESSSNANSEPFNGLILYEDRKIDRRSKLERLLCVRAKRDRSEMRISAEKFLENITPAFIRFPEFSIDACPDEVLLKFLRDSKQHFLNCHLCFLSQNPDEKYLQKLEEMLSDSFLKPSAIYFHSPSFASEKILNTTGARNCDKVEIWIDNYPKCTKDTFVEWFQWKQNQSGSGRHLVLIGWQLALTANQEILEDLKHAFETATKPLSYVITFAQQYYDDIKNLGEFHLDNERTRERLSLFKDKRYCYRLWRRTVTSSDSTWLWALIGGTKVKEEGHDVLWMNEKEVKEAARKTGFDKKLYDYYLPKSYDLV